MGQHSGDFDYDSKGAGYAQVRRPDRRIEAFIHRALGAAGSVVNVGAGAGSYEPVDRCVLAIEPSATMRSQRPPGRPAIQGFAEALPLDDDAVDAAMAVMTVHQWADLETGLCELRRVARGPVVVVTGDGEALPSFWLNDYAPELIAAERRRYPEIAYIAERIGARSEVTNIPIPLDCADGLCEAFYGRPEGLLEASVRRAQSSWSFAPNGTQERFVAALRTDLASGLWDQRHGRLRTQPSFDGSLRLVVGWPA